MDENLKAELLNDRKITRARRTEMVRALDTTPMSVIEKIDTLVLSMDLRIEKLEKLLGLDE